MGHENTEENNMMTKREWVTKVFHNEPTDRVPVGFWFHFLLDDQLNIGLYHDDYLEKNVAGHKAYIEAYDPDFVKVMTDGLFTRPGNTMPAVYCAKDLYGFEPLPVGHAYFEACLDLAKKVRGLAGEDRLVFFNIFSPLFALTKYLNDGVSNVTVNELLDEDPDAVVHALEVLGDDMCRMVRLVMTEGKMDGIYLSVNNAKRVIPLVKYEKYIAHSEVKILDAANELGDMQILHICGYHGAQNYLAAYRDYPAQIINWAVHVEAMTLAEGKKYFYGKPVIGGFDQQPGGLINVGGEEEIRAFTRGIIEECGKTGIVIGADCTVPSDTPLEHLVWVKDEVAKICG